MSNIEERFLDPTTHLTPDSISTDALEKKIRKRNQSLKMMGMKIAIKAMDCYFPK